MKKHLFIISFILVMLLAISAVSASDSNDVADDSAISEASLSDCVQSVDGEVESTVDEQQNDVDVLSEDGNNQTPAVNVNTVTINENDIPYVPFNVTDSEGNIISGGVNVTICGENGSISKYIEINNVTGQSNFSIVDLIKLIELNKGCNISDIIYSSVNYNNINISELISGLEEIYGGCNISVEDVIHGTDYIIDGTKLNQEKFTEGMNYIIADIKIDDLMFIDGFKEILNGIDINGPNFILDLSNYLNESGVNVSQVTNDLKAILNEFKIDSSDFDNLLDAIGITNKGLFLKGVWGIINVFDIKITYVTVLNLITKGVPAVIKELAPQIININSIYKMIDPNFDRTGLLNAVGYLMESVSIDSDKVSTAIMDMCSKINSSEIMYRLDRISQEIDFNSPEFKDALNKSIENNVHIDHLLVSDGLTKVIDAVDYNKSIIYEGLAKIISAFSFNRASVLYGVSEVINALDLNDSIVCDGVYKVVNGLGINTSSIVSQLVARFGYIATFPGHVLAPGVYNVTAEYVGSEGYDSAINDTAKLIVLPKIDTPIKFDVVVDGYKVTVKGSLNPNATGLVLFKIGDYDVFNLIVGGKVAFDDIFEPGDYDIEAIYLGDSNFNQNGTLISFTVKSPTVISASPVSTIYGNSKNMVVTLKDYAGKVVVGKTVTVKLNGKTYTGVTNDKGQISVAVPKNLKPKTYTASIAFAGDDKYVKSTGSVKVVVSKATPKIIATKKTFKAATKTKKYTITLKVNNNAMKNTKVTLKVNGKTYSAKTNSNGKATFKITKLTKKGTFKSVITYNGNDYYKKVTKNVNIVVK